MAIVTSAASGIGALGLGVGRMGGGLLKGVWGAGGGGKGFLLGGAAGGIYGAASADPHESSLMRGLKGAGIGAIGGAIGGSLVGAGARRAGPMIDKAKGALSRSGKAADDIPLSALEMKAAKRTARRKDKVVRGAQKLFRQQEKNPLAWDIARQKASLNRGSRIRGAFGSAVRRAKNHKNQWMAEHRANRVFRGARQKLPAARRARQEMRDLGYGADVNKFARQHGPIAPTDRRLPGELPWGVRTDGPVRGMGEGRVSTSPIMNVNSSSPMVRAPMATGTSGRVAPAGNANAVAANQGRRAGLDFRAAELGYDEVEQTLAGRGLNGVLQPYRGPRSGTAAFSQGRKAGSDFRAAELGYDEVEQTLAGRGLNGALQPRRGASSQGTSAVANWGKTGTTAPAAAPRGPGIDRSNRLNFKLPNWVDML